MQDHELVWQFGAWISRRESGAARLAWTDGEMVIRLRRGNVVTVEGLDADSVCRVLECEPAGHEELLEEARHIAAECGVPETQALGAVKEILQEAIASWLLDRNRRLEIVDEELDDQKGSKISVTHTMVELVLNDSDRDFIPHILPDFNVVLRRADNFLELYSPLRLSEEADLVVARITGQRTAGEISSQSPQGSPEVDRLLAALVATGMLEPVPAADVERDVDVLAVDLPTEEATRKELPVRWIAAVAFFVVVILASVAWLALRPRTVEPPPTDSSWTLVIDMGCEPEELQRVLKKARQYPNVLRPVQANTGDDNPCWRLVWGRFPTRADAEQGAADLPESLRMDGFEIHAIELPDEIEQPEAE